MASSLPFSRRAGRDPPFHHHPAPMRLTPIYPLICVPCYFRVYVSGLVVDGNVVGCIVGCVVSCVINCVNGCAGGFAGTICWGKVTEVMFKIDWKIGNTGHETDALEGLYMVTVMTGKDGRRPAYTLTTHLWEGRGMDGWSEEVRSMVAIMVGSVA